MDKFDQAKDDMKQVLASPAGRRVLRRVLSQTNLFVSCYCPGDALGTAYNEGLRALGLWLRAYIESDDRRAFAQLIMEEGENNGPPRGLNQH